MYSGQITLFKCFDIMVTKQTLNLLFFSLFDMMAVVLCLNIKDLKCYLFRKHFAMSVFIYVRVTHIMFI